MRSGQYGSDQQRARDQHKNDEASSRASVSSPWGRLLRVPTVRRDLGDMPHSTYYDRLDPRSQRHDPDLPRPKPYLGGRCVYVLEADHLDYLSKIVAKARTGRTE